MSDDGYYGGLVIFCILAVFFIIYVVVDNGQKTAIEECNKYHGEMVKTLKGFECLKVERVK